MIEIPTEALAQIRRHARETYPEECCGALLGELSGESARIQRVEALVNRSAEERGRRYVVSPEDYVRVERGAEKEGLSLLGFYHSHPDHPAHWSPTDLAEAHWFGCSYVITSVEEGKAVVTNSFELAGSDEADKQLVDEKVELET